jgi:chromosome partitioning protein
MQPGNSPKTIATINFKGGVGKTTVTWCLGDIVSTTSNVNVLMFDLDAQMSLTQAIALNETTGGMTDEFGKWYANAVERKRTIFDALEAYTAPKTGFDFPVKRDFVYEISNQFHFVPSVEDLYWLELADAFDRDKVKDFIRRLLGKISSSRALPDYQYVLFDCPPSFTLLSYSVLACCDLILIPVNPDFFAARGTSLILNSLRMRIEPHPIPKIGVFMNKAYARPNPSKETRAYMRDVRLVCESTSQRENIRARFFDTFIRERVGIKRAITGGGVPPEFVPEFKALWKDCVEFLNE